VAAAIAGVALVERWFARERRSLIVIGSLAVAWWLVITSYAHAAAIWMRRGHNEGLGYASRSWQESDVLRQARALPKNVLIYTNEAHVFTLITGRPSLDLPFKHDFLSRQPNPRYWSEIDTLRARLQRGAVVVYLNRAHWPQWVLPPESALREELGLHVRARGTDGTIYDRAPRGDRY
jgi:hypothetical protein